MSYRVLVLLLLPTISAIPQSAPKVQATGSINAVKTMVNALYHNVVIHHPYSLLDGPDAKMFSPYLSESLSQKLQSARDCSRDWFRQNQGKAVKAPFAWSAFGIFSGYNERDSPGSFRIERTEAEKDGSFRVDVELRYKPSDGPGVWHVEAVVVREGGHLAVDDVIFLKSKDSSPQAPGESRLSELLSQGCDGPHWVGNDNQRR